MLISCELHVEAVRLKNENNNSRLSDVWCIEPTIGIYFLKIWNCFKCTSCDTVYNWEGSLLTTSLLCCMISVTIKIQSSQHFLFYCLIIASLWHVLVTFCGHLQAFGDNCREMVWTYIALHSIKMMDCGIPVFLLFSCETKDCGKLLLCHMLVHVPTTKCQESSAVQEMPHQCSISQKMPSLPSDRTRQRCAVVSSTCGHKTQNVCTSRDRLCLCMVQVWYPFNGCGNGFVALQLVG